MPLFDAAIAWTANLILALLLAELFLRGLWRSCLSFTVYVAAVLVPDALMAASPRFYTWELWFFAEILHGLLKFAIAVELSFKTLAAFPGARATARRVVLAVLTVSFLAVVAVPGPQAHEEILSGQVLPRMLNGTVWLFTAVGAVILWYRIPLREPLHKAILVGFVPYLLVFTAGQNLLNVFGWHLREFANHVETMTYVGLEAYWLVVVLRSPLPRRTPAPRVPLAGGSPAE